MSVHSRLRWSPLLVLAAVVAPHGACIEDGYPLPESGSVTITPDVSTALYATDTLDASGQASGPRQRPYETGVSLDLREGEEPAHGAFVHVRVDPPEALVLSSDPTEETPSCEYVEGTFRCVASEEGAARLVVRSQGDRSGTVRVVASWAGDSTSAAEIEVKPPGLPAEAANFDLLLGKDSTKKILAKYDDLTCTTDNVAITAQEKWRPGKIRAVSARARVSPPADNPLVVENAPVLIEALDPEAEISLTEDCAERTRVLRVVLDGTGTSPEFFLCFSDAGGSAEFAFSSGEQSGSAPGADLRVKSIEVEPEPRVIRVRRIRTQVEVGDIAQVFEVTAFDADRTPIELAVDLDIDTSILDLTEGAAAVTSADPGVLSLSATGVAPGTAVLSVSPRLIGDPTCDSLEVLVVDPSL